ncbi:MAG TPA: hypothetical protein VFW45_00755, partial [Candidatus Polarisedimenticolia bacterium]|nr:hypothetical protein [Candidatus Polarisedimenticolia bacterium]
MESKPGRYGTEDLFVRALFHPGYWKTLARLLRWDRTRVTLEDSMLRFSNYGFEPASVFPSGSITKDQIQEINLASYPSQLRLKSGEVLFIPQVPRDREALLAFVDLHDLPTQRRSSVWGALLEPFLDSSEEQETIDRQFTWFAKVGLDREEVDRIRREIGIAMIAYNFGTRLWEWAILGMYDALRAQRARLSRKDFADFYGRAMRLAALDPVATDTPATTTTVSDTLFSVLLEWYPRKKPGKIKDFTKEWTARTEKIEALKKTLLEQLTAAYSEPHRRYHSLAHLESCVNEVSGAWSRAVHLEEVRWAVLFHDAVYDLRRQDNEARSAAWALHVMDELGRPEEEKARVQGMILATAHSGKPHTTDEALIMDIDLSILGADEATFDEYERNVRAEYEWVPEEIYRRERAAILQPFLNRERIYHTSLYRRR